MCMQHETPLFLHLNYPQRNQYAADSFILRLRDTTEVVYRRRSKGRQNANNPFRYPNGKPMVSGIKTIGFEYKNHRFSDAKPNDNDNVNVNGNVNVNVNGNVNVNVNVNGNVNG